MASAIDRWGSHKCLFHQTPCSIYRQSQMRSGSEAIVAWPIHLAPGESLVMEWSRLGTGHLRVTGHGRICFRAVPAGWKSTAILRNLDSTALPTVSVELSAQPCELMISGTCSAMHLYNSGSKFARITAATLGQQSTVLNSGGRFQCDSASLNRAWIASGSYLSALHNPWTRRMLRLSPMVSRTLALSWNYARKETWPLPPVIPTADWSTESTSAQLEELLEAALWSAISEWDHYMLHADCAALRNVVSQRCDKGVRWITALLQVMETQLGQCIGHNSIPACHPTTRECGSAPPVSLRFLASAYWGLRALEQICQGCKWSEDALNCRVLAGRARSQFEARVLALRAGDVQDDTSIRRVVSWGLLTDLIPREHASATLTELYTGYRYDNPTSPDGSPMDLSYEIVTRFHCGDASRALELCSLVPAYEDVSSDGCAPGDERFAWSMTGWALQRYLLGLKPVRPGWNEYSFSPVHSRLRRVEGAVCTPHGSIEVEYEWKGSELFGRIVQPEGLRLHMENRHHPGLEVMTKE